MNKYNKLKLKTEDGAALVWVLILMTIVITLTASMTYVASQDIHETRLHEERLKTYYIALAGVDLGYASLMANSGSEPYINQFLNDSTKTVTDTIEIFDGLTKKGEAVVTLESVTVDSKRWIRVYSVGTLLDGTQSVASILRINPDNTQHTIRESFTP
ncbi:hypothetical protein QE109_14775 [Fusibacter bizertensis]|uniref:Type 4 fimbrial biogenesis protein PilX N-terminal domain-containing protein n=1 Tax=Fusibacter bizertensis TaxID=1488331 RepID=A0ABT6NGE3_9FIRM|nr:hypothetical protein [Fusibacter bizertensis]MDH8679420.1 hypothetical protein [Fusibacter bizertensis]